MILFAVDGPAPLRLLATLQRAIRRDGAIWVVWPTGQPLKRRSDGIVHPDGAAELSTVRDHPVHDGIRAGGQALEK